MSFQVPRTVFTLPIRLIDRLTIDERARRTSPRIVCIDIAHIDEETRIRDIGRQRRIQLVFGRYPMKPYGGFTRTDLTMNCLTFGVSIHAPTIEAERANEEIVSCLNVLVRQNRNDSLDLGHDALLR